MKTRCTFEVLSLAGLVAGMIFSQGCTTVYKDDGMGEEQDLSLRPQPASLDPEPVGPVIEPTPVEAKEIPYWKQREMDADNSGIKLTEGKNVIGGAVYTGYTVKKNETLSGIAWRYGLRWRDVAAINPDIDINKLTPGQVISLPGAIDLAHPVRTVSAASAKKSTANVSAPSSDGTYTVKSGDILGRIARRHGVKISDLKKANGLTSDKISVGQKLVIPAKGSSAKPVSEIKAPAAVTVKPIEVPVEVIVPPVIAPKAETVDPVFEEVVPPAIEQPIIAPEVTASEVTASAVVPVVAEAAPAPVVYHTYTVVEGDDLAGLGIRWGVDSARIKALNNLSSNKLIPGTVIKIPPFAD